MLHRQKITWFTLPSLLIVTALLTAPTLLAEDAPVCEGFADKDRIELLGGPKAFLKGGTSSPADLASKLEAHHSEIHGLMQQHGVGHLTDALIATVRDGRGLSERNLERGEVFDWMAFREKSGPVTRGPVCFAAKKSYSAYMVDVREESTEAARAVCKLRATGTVVGEDIRVDVSGSSSGVEVEMTSPDGQTRTILAGDASTWDGPASAPGTYSFTATAEAQGTTTVTTHSFAIPKICLNVAYAGSSATEEAGEVTRCSETLTVEIEDPMPECSLSVPAEIARKELFTVDATGKYDDITIRVTDDQGREVEVRDENGDRMSEIVPPKSVYLKKAGTYTFEGTATNRAGETTCTASVSVISSAVTSPWTLRGSYQNFNTDDDEIFRSRTRTVGNTGPFTTGAGIVSAMAATVSERSSLRLDGGDGLAFGVEYRFNERIGLEGSVSFTDMDASFILDLDNDWERDTDSATALGLQVGPNFHLTPQSRVDLYLGLFVGFLDIDNVSFTTLGETTNAGLDSDVYFGAQLGLDIPFGDRPVGLHLGVRYLDLAIEEGEDLDEGGRGEEELNADPFISEIGFFYRF